MAPEMYEEQYDEGIDVYAFGMCMLEMATSEYPYNECLNAGQIYRRVTAGIRPAAFEKIEEAEIKEIIDRCIRYQKSERYTVRDLLSLEFFLEDNAVRVEFVKKETDIHSVDSKILLRVRVPEARASKLKYKENEAIQFEFDIAAESAEAVAQDMVKSGYLLEEDQRAVAKQIKDRTSEIMKERELLKTKKKTDLVTPPLPSSLAPPNFAAAPSASDVNKASPKVPVPEKMVESMPIIEKPAENVQSKNAKDILKELDEKLTHITMPSKKPKGLDLPDTPTYSATSTPNHVSTPPHAIQLPNQPESASSGVFDRLNLKLAELSGVDSEPSSGSRANDSGSPVNSPHEHKTSPTEGAPSSVTSSHTAPATVTAPLSLRPNTETINNTVKPSNTENGHGKEGASVSSSSSSTSVASTIVPPTSLPIVPVVGTHFQELLPHLPSKSLHKNYCEMFSPAASAIPHHLLSPTSHHSAPSTLLVPTQVKKGRFGVTTIKDAVTVECAAQKAGSVTSEENRSVVTDFSASSGITFSSTSSHESTSSELLSTPKVLNDKVNNIFAIERLLRDQQTSTKDVERRGSYGDEDPHSWSELDAIFRRHAKERDDLAKRQQEELRNFFTLNGARNSQNPLHDSSHEGPHLTNGVAAVSATQPFLTVSRGGYSDDNEPRSEGVVGRSSSLRSPKRVTRRKLLYRKRVATVTLMPFQLTNGLRRMSKQHKSMDRDVDVQ
ncbi:hypothetical protein RvY_04980 [Ramazzottius varieornatus]|uniref:non-specific serine/threonine protein kinase n=1 Tax=Ramazzottius varieornatus TaxID=947166 RepID=A0A1D1UU31_RAMVA|nr:hypothetical protein RvY_04980 [Ramazzottius varieornatus]